MMTDDQELFNLLILTRLSYFHLSTIVELYRRVGSATEIMSHRAHLEELDPEISPKIVSLFDGYDSLARRAEEEMRWLSDHQVQPLALGDPDYPQLMRECSDPPLMLFYKGVVALNRPHVVAVVGTRHCTPYGQDVIRQLIGQLKALLPDTLIVSGLAYGVDVRAHREALDSGMETVGVLAHGLDTLYPAAHREVANEIAVHGGLLTEYMSGTNAGKQNFIRRNRIIAGISHCTLLVESASHGGGMVTASIANSYGRDVFAVPGALGAVYSEGCNHLIRDDKARLVTTAEDILKAMGWEDDRKVRRARREGIERQLFPELSSEEKRIVGLLQKRGDLQLNLISVQSGIPIGQAMALLFQLEMKGVVRNMAGGTYHLIR